MNNHQNARLTVHGRELLVKRLTEHGLRHERPRRRRGETPYRYHQISRDLDVGLSSVARILRREGLNRLAHLAPAKPVQRYEYDEPGGLLHLDINKLGRFQRPGHRVTGDHQQHSRGCGWSDVFLAPRCLVAAVGRGHSERVLPPPPPYCSSSPRSRNQMNSPLPTTRTPPSAVGSFRGSPNNARLIREAASSCEYMNGDKVDAGA